MAELDDELREALAEIAPRPANIPMISSQSRRFSVFTACRSVGSGSSGEEPPVDLIQ